MNFLRSGVRGAAREHAALRRSDGTRAQCRAVALLAHVHRLPVVCDPSHAAGRRDLVVPLGRAALAAGAAGLLVEVHEHPGDALSDGPQALPPAALSAFLEVTHG